MRKSSNRAMWFTATWLWAFSGLAGAEAPDLVLKDLSGKDRNINEYIGQGRWTIVPVWSADCPICRREMYHMTFLYEEHKHEGTLVLGLSIDGYEQRDKVQDFVDEQSINFPTLIGDPRDASRISGRPFGGTPTYYFFAPNGTFLTAHEGAMTQAQAERTVKRLKKEQPRRRVQPRLSAARLLGKMPIGDMAGCRRFKITGYVQGVGFRYAARAQAQRLGLTGWVRNLPTGEVEALACGDADRLHAFERWLWQGPRAARVTAVTASDAPAQEFDGFEVRG